MGKCIQVIGASTLENVVPDNVRLKPADLNPNPMDWGDRETRDRGIS